MKNPSPHDPHDPRTCRLCAPLRHPANQGARRTLAATLPKQTTTGRATGGCR